MDEKKLRAWCERKNKQVKDLQERVEKLEAKAKRGPKAKGTCEELRAYAKEIDLPASDGEAMFDMLEANGWKRGTVPLKDWKAHIRSWKAQGYHPSQNGKTDPKDRQFGFAKARHQVEPEDEEEATEEEIEELKAAMQQAVRGVVR